MADYSRFVSIGLMITLLIFDARKSILAPEECTKKQSGYVAKIWKIVTMTDEGICRGFYHKAYSE
ncbi:hypothetical protein DJ533_18620 [Acinetobacter defluvii]|uniref:Uncharacterized protein n=1 Tax=Acinetobacter defluvii TaxID=1871111 RepID=A0A5B9D562_9GAMM|nr:hypothetical protein [Acinetobacter defluvii]QEE14164.1 hypothetical protein DJ533_18620 [Acinetobacter defluvii]